MGSRRSFLPARAGVLTLVTALVATGTAVLTAAPASAQTVTETTASSWAYVDSAAPKASFVNQPGNAPVGAHTYAGGTNHVFKSYVTFDISALKGNPLERAYVSTGETAVTDCAHPRSTEVWLTDPAKKPTWNNQPAELVKATGPYIDSSCPSRQVTWTVTAAIQAAMDAGRTTATFVLRLPEDQQNDPASGREYNPRAVLGLTFDKTPGKPSGLSVNYQACTAKPTVVSRQAHLSATVPDGDDSIINGEFAFWPADAPDQRKTVGTMGAGLNGEIWTDADSFLTEGVTYVWQARGKDYQGVWGPWSGTCKFTTDFTPPAAAPVITSADYAAQAPPGAGGTGVPGTFVFDAKGDKDVVGFRWDGGYVAADRKGGKATVRYAPKTSGPVSIGAVSVDAAGNQSPSAGYRFWVASNQPGVTCAPFDDFVGVARTCTFTPVGSTPVTAYVYHLGNQPDDTVAAGPDGTATVQVTPTDPDLTYLQLSVRAQLATGYLTSESSETVVSEPGEPEVESLTANPTQGLPAQFRVHAVLPGSVSFTYHWNDGEMSTVPLDADGTATVTLTPATSSWGSFYGYTTTASGQNSGWGGLNVSVASNKPKVTSAEYPEGGGMTGAVGVPGTFVFSSPVPGAVSYTYEFDNGVHGTVAAGPDGTASVVFTPTEPYINSIYATTKFADGSVSEQGGYTFYVNYSAPRFECDATGWSVAPGQHIQCTLSPVQANLASYGYAVDSGPETTVAPGPDGTATIGFDVPADRTSGSYVQLRLWSTNTAGTRTDETGTSFYVYVNTGTSARTAHAV
ncbi:DNRLRE domain-containing protein [Amycolatopsis sp. NPDC048633]|uniref:DNRLRE domain-containing protein n=1 Tax=Amycolatopsis sp. NPDC048633 TaxID=3157095 RepID=UPI0033F3ACC8